MNSFTYKDRVKQDIEAALKSLQNAKTTIDTSSDLWKITSHLDEAATQLTNAREAVRIVSKKAFEQIMDGE